jgi:hypothetical protein
MVKNSINISEIETYLHSIIDNVVSKNTYAGTLPDTIQSDWNDMCLIDVGGAINDLNAYGKGVVHILLYARPLLTGAKNVALMSQLENRLNEVVANASDKHYIINRRTTYTDYDATRKWHCNIVALNLIIV